MPCWTEQQDVCYGTGISMLCWWLQCCSTLIKLSAGRGETATDGHWLGMASGRAGEPRERRLEK